MNYNCYTVYKIKPEYLPKLEEHGVLVLSDEGLADITYLFKPENSSENIKDFTGDSFLTDLKSLISEEQVHTMLKNSNKRAKIEVGNIVNFKGLGRLDLYVEELSEEIATLTPVGIPLFRKIESGLEDLKISGNTPSLTQEYNCLISIDCDMIPSYNSPHYFELVKTTLVKILYEVSNMLDLVQIDLLNPTPLVALAGASLGIPTHEGTLDNILSDTNFGNKKVILYDLKKHCILDLKNVVRGSRKTLLVDYKESLELYRYWVGSGALSESKGHSLYNSLYLTKDGLLDIKIKDNPMGKA